MEIGAALRGRVLYDGASLGRPQVVAVAGDRLVIADHGGGNMVLVLDRATGRPLASWGRKGRGPGEFLSIWSVQRADRRGAVWLFDPSQGRLTLLDVDSLVTRAQTPAERIFTLHTDLLPMDARWISDAQLVSTGLFTAGRLAFFDSAGTLRGFAGPLPPARDGVPTPVTQHAYSGTLAVHPTRTMVALATRNSDRLEIYRANGSLVRVARGPLAFEPQYVLRYRGDQPSMATGDDLRFGYVDLAVAGERLFALYSGNTRAERPGRANFGGEIHVFDWSGTLRARYALDQRALTIAVDEAGRSLYAIRHDPVPAVVVYQIPAEAFQ